MSDWIRNRDKSRFVHYEQAQYSEIVDVVSFMYSTAQRIAEAAIEENEKPQTRPIMLCEYAHAMGIMQHIINPYLTLSFICNNLFKKINRKQHGKSGGVLESFRRT